MFSKAFLILSFLPFCLPASGAVPKAADHRIHVQYWEKWTGFEKEAMQAIVDDYNRSQDRITVDYTSVALVDQKTLVATAGGVPPDIAGLWFFDLVPFADKEALIPLDGYLAKAHITSANYVPVYWKSLLYKGHIWALPSTPYTIALHWNKGMFRRAGLDPERPPRTIAELDADSRRLTKLNKDGEIVQMGFLPADPGWWNYAWGYFFGGKLWDGGRNITCDSPENQRAYEWVQSYAKDYGQEALKSFQSAYTTFSWEHNTFMMGKVGMVLQGVWMANFISQYAPDMEWGAAPFPPVKEGDDPVTIAGSDMLMIPRGARHPDEAFDFIRYVNRQGPMEKLCLLQKKNSPLAKVSDSFYARHSNPYIRVFADLAWSRNAVVPPMMGVWTEYMAELNNGFDKVWLMKDTPDNVLKEVKNRVQPLWDRELEHSHNRRSPLLEKAPLLLTLLGVLGAILGIWVHRGIQRRRLPAGTRLPRGKLAAGLLFAAPGLAGFLVFMLFPIITSLVYSFCDYSILAAPRWVGLDNFRALASDQVFWISVRNTLYYAAFALPLGLLLSFLCALLLDSKIKGTDTYRTLYFLPFVAPLVANTMAWYTILDPRYGVLNHILGLLSLGSIKPVAWLADTRTAMPSLIFMSLWGVGQTMVIMLAALQDVPTSLYEAAELDGANGWQKILHVAVPYISPVLYFNAIIGLIGCLQVFVVPYILTGGGPARATEFYGMYLWENAFTFLRMGYASAMAWILFLIILGLTGLFVRYANRRVTYTGGGL